MMSASTLAEESHTRKFYDLPSRDDAEVNKEVSDNKEVLRSYINDNIIGKNATFLSPFGRKRIVYCDYTASGKSLQFIEDFIQSEVLPTYGNTHTTTTVTSLQTTLYRHEARDVVRNSVNAGEHDAVIFTGSGCTGAVHKLISGLQLETPTVFVGPHEHHSNILPWRELGGKVVNIGEDEFGRTNLNILEEELRKNVKEGKQMIGCFSAASNVTGVMEDDIAVTVLLHKYGALAFWDYATAAAYVKVDMNPKIPADPDGLCYKDAVFFSVHKFVGGVQTPGILVAKKFLFRNRVPNGSGGGSVFFVREDGHRYLKEPEVREEGGTPAIVESVRAGLVIKLKNALGPQYIINKEKEMRELAVAAWQKEENLIIIGPKSQSHLPIFSFLIRHPSSGLYLHHNFVVSLLNDLYGIQTRGGCACAGPYMQTLLGLSPELTRRYEDILLEDDRLDRIGLRRGHAEYSSWEVLRPGVTRINIPFFASQEEVEYIVAAVKEVARNGWKLLPLYRMNNETGEWRHSANTVFKDRRWLGNVSFSSGEMKFAASPLQQVGKAPDTLDGALEEAEKVFSNAMKLVAREIVPDQSQAFPPQAAQLRWFLTPSEAKMDLLCEGSVTRKVPFVPKQYEAVSYKTPGSLAGCNVTSQVQGWLAQGGPSISWKLLDKQIKDKSPVKRGVDVTVNGVDPQIKAKKIDPAEVVLDCDDEQLIDLGDNCDNYRIDSAANGVNPLIYAKKFDTAEEVLDCNDEKRIDLGDNFHIDSAVNGVDPQINAKKFDPAEEYLDCDDESRIDLGDGCDNGVCLLPGGVRNEPAPTLTPGTAKWKCPPKEIFKPFLEAVEQFSMIKSGDRVLICLSGGKDSLSLLHTIHQYQFYAKKKGINFDLGAVTVDPMSSAYDPRPLIPYLAQLGVEYLYEQQDIMAQAMESGCSSICAFCSRMKRGRIYAAARRANYNVLAMGQHLDDIAESFFMSVFHNGRLRSMKANYSVVEGDLRVIRPLVYVRENTLRKFAESRGLPIIAENCPACFEIPKERQRTKQLLAQQELLFPRLYWNLKTALYPLIKIDKTGVETALFGKAVAENESDEQNEDELYGGL